MLLVINDEGYSRIDATLEAFRLQYGEVSGMEEVVEDDEVWAHALINDGLTVLEEQDIEPMSLNEYFS